MFQGKVNFVSLLAFTLALRNLKCLYFSVPFLPQIFATLLIFLVKEYDHVYLPKLKETSIKRMEGIHGTCNLHSQ